MTVSAAFEIGDMVKVRTRYDSWLGIVKRIYTDSLSVQPIGWVSTPHFVPFSLAEKITNLYSREEDKK